MAGTLNKVIGYFDLQSHQRGKAVAQGAPAEGSGATLHVFPQYIALVLGIFIQPYFDQYRATNQWNVDWSHAVGWAVFSALVALFIFPTVYRKSFDAGQPIFVQFCVIFVAGIGWKTVFTTVAHATGS